MKDCYYVVTFISASKKLILTHYLVDIYNIIIPGYVDMIYVNDPFSTTNEC